ncbi:MAG: transporter [Verrucomicrobia bacterium]|nr:transporter [Verrucomicrobiota bacterium]
MVLCLFAVAASAAWERTVSAWDTRLPAQGKVQLSLWGDYWASEAAGADATTLNGTLYLTYGIADNWSACVAPSFTRWDVDGGDSETGISDTDVMTTYRFMDEAEAGVDLAVQGRVQIPTGDEDKGLGTGHVEPKLMLLASKALGPIIAVANLGGIAVLDANDGEEDFILRAELEGIYPLSDQLSLNAVVSAMTARWDGADDMVDLGVGARFTPQEQLFVLGAGYVCFTDAYDWGAQIAAGFEF